MLCHILTGLISLAALFLARGELPSASEIPFVFTNGLIWIQVTVPEAKEPLHFLFDSGAAVSVVNLGTAERLGLKLGPSVRVSGVGGSSRGYWPQRLDATAGGISLPGKFLTTDLAQLSDACNCCVDGLLGADFVRGRTVQIDFTARKLRLIPAKSAPDAGVVLDLKTTRGGLLAPVAVNGGKPKWVRVDTGCTSALQWVADTAPAKQLSEGVSIGLAESSIPLVSANVWLGSMEFAFVATGWHRKPIFAGEGGLLGNGLLSRFDRVTLDARASKLILSGQPGAR